MSKMFHECINSVRIYLGDETFEVWKEFDLARMELLNKFSSARMFVTVNLFHHSFHLDFAKFSREIFLRPWHFLHAIAWNSIDNMHELESCKIKIVD